ncbi:hypothetical protein AUEXF2481DRAFT_7839 [Aureobasidium subglaciale EXF-2481]|uniref:Microtubule associated protein n=1 Tax=Aureobasidium subglaciale (strain EXF-2481) TaxID=1043005 RepID=A0A074Y861_AURSE|nr:uncharacterized protein AUEXF2481DRAFT_7839 [Aureobasidium subglaciale EXF-2481]KAI5207931.1 hypothetical protein E4T38_03154 [Aureobasidium subglaciale]KAI5226988.1 hypothetical protein E4T40_02928 [Aureobasidium subglaciale]KAI5230094.1 hypothetical protein E4T41_03151 [Aureobasidium subglaciale]KAI5264668.1 hypothetical protein E4T46_02929 [Aureobasidium subglaciale]KEQ92139.1 hypothetical protein AUEXF2481DRAFT_7839 [Aureobasidium subglaciale EXF-2481]
MANTSARDCQPSNGFVHAMRRVYHPLGFSKGYNAVLAFLALGYLFGFTLARLQYLSYNGVFCNANASGGTGAAPGECYYYLQVPFKVGMKLHLFTVIPASLLVVLQFIPVIRHKIILFHRMNGYAIVILSLISNAGTIIITRHAFGGEFATQTWTGAMVILTTIGYIMAWVNIKLLQIDQHRAWMLRTWAWFSTIVTIRIIMIISAQIISTNRNWYTTRPCAQIAFALGQNDTLAAYPQCEGYFNGNAPNLPVVVTVDFSNDNSMELSAALAVPFGAAGWLALLLHTIAIEGYLRLTPKESNRLRQVSYERQLERGMSRPGYAGLTVERFGDAEPFQPQAKIEHEHAEMKQDREERF